MAGLWRRNPGTPEGKFPIVLRRDGSPLTARFLVLTLKDPCAPAAFWAYAAEAERLEMDPAYVAGMRWLAEEAVAERDRVARGEKVESRSNPDAPPHRTDDPVVLAWARSLNCPGS